MEQWDLYTKYREKTGKTQIRGEKIPEGFYHLVVDVWIRNSKGEYLISQRAASRPTFPLMWECVGGSVIQGEDSITGAVREVKEEVGIDLLPEDGKLLFTKIKGVINGEHCNDITDVWLFEYDGELMLEQATTDEVVDCKWMTKEEIKVLINDGKFVHTLDYFFSVLDMKEQDYSDIIGKTVSGKISRPLGSSHSGITYLINYGQVRDVFTEDGSEQNVYVFGSNKPLQEFTGTIIAVYHHFNDVKDTWIVSLDGKEISDEKILGDIAFKEQFFYGKLYR